VTIQLGVSLSKLSWIVSPQPHGQSMAAAQVSDSPIR
jgi:hypothetical protein